MKTLIASVIAIFIAGMQPAYAHCDCQRTVKQDEQLYANLGEYPLYANSKRVQKMINRNSDKADIEQ